jgi:hypothetical protein
LAIGVPLSVTAPTAGSPPSGQLNHTSYWLGAGPLSEKMLLSATDWSSATV